MTLNSRPLIIFNFPDDGVIENIHIWSNERRKIEANFFFEKIFNQDKIGTVLTK